MKLNDYAYPQREYNSIMTSRYNYVVISDFIRVEWANDGVRVFDKVADTIKFEALYDDEKDKCETR